MRRILIGGLVGAMVVAPPAAAARSVPPGFVGVMADGPMFFSPAFDSNRELRLMRSAGVESLRVGFYWDLAQPYPPGTPLPPGFVDVDGVPTSFARTDKVVAEASRAGLRMLPVVLAAPPWARLNAAQRWSPPRADAYSRYASFLDALVRRYRRTIHSWQVWNEPNRPYFWTLQPGMRAYGDLLRVASNAIRTADPTARVVLAGLSDRSWQALAELYRAGLRRSFDAVAANPFTARVRDVLHILGRDRKVMARYGDARKPLLVTETSWPSALGHVTVRYGYEESARGQARKLREALLAFARERTRLRLQQVFWYTWMTFDHDTAYPFDWSGLRRFDGARVHSKPALLALRAVARRLEGRRR
jgi:hypothetical protein